MRQAATASPKTPPAGNRPSAAMAPATTSVGTAGTRHAELIAQHVYEQDGQTDGACHRAILPRTRRAGQGRLRAQPGRLAKIAATASSMRFAALSPLTSKRL